MKKKMVVYKYSYNNGFSLDLDVKHITICMIFLKNNYFRL